MTTGWDKHAGSANEKNVRVYFFFFTNSSTPLFSKSRTIVCNDEPSGSAHYFEPTSFLEALDRHFRWAVTIILPISPGVERIDRVVAHSLRNKRALFVGSPCCMTKVRGHPLVLSTASRTPPIASLLSRVQTKSTKCSLQMGIDDNEDIRTTKKTLIDLRLAR